VTDDPRSIVSRDQSTRHLMRKHRRRDFSPYVPDLKG
jgi:hypothetical protein